MFDLPLFEQIHMRPIVQIRVLEHDGKNTLSPQLPPSMILPSPSSLHNHNFDHSSSSSSSVGSITQSLFEDVFGLKKMSFHHGRTNYSPSSSSSTSTTDKNRTNSSSTTKTSSSGSSNNNNNSSSSSSNSNSSSSNSGSPTTTNSGNVVQLYRCQAKFTCDHLRDWNRLMMGDDYEQDLSQTVVFQFEFANDYHSFANSNNQNNKNNSNVMMMSSSSNLSSSSNSITGSSSSSSGSSSSILSENEEVNDDNEAYFQLLSEYDGTLIVLTPGTTVQSFENTFLRDMRLTPEKIVAHNIHFLNICVPRYLSNNADDVIFEVDHIDPSIRFYIHNLFPNNVSASTARRLGINANADKNTTSTAEKSGQAYDSFDDKADEASLAVEQLFNADDTTELNKLFKRTILRMLLDVYKYDRFRVGYDVKGYKEALFRHEFMYDKLFLLSKLEHPYFGAELAALNSNFNLPLCQVRFTNRMNPQFDPMKMLSKLGWEDLKYDTQLAVVQTYTKHYLFQSGVDDTEYATVFLTAESLKFYTKYYKNNKGAMDPWLEKLSKIVSMGRFGKHGLPNYKAPTYSIDYRSETINVDVWVCEYPSLLEDNLSEEDVIFSQWRYSFPCIGVRMKISRLYQFYANDYKRKRSRASSLFSCIAVL